MSSSYTAFAPTKPIGTDTGPNVVTSANANDLVNWYAVVQGLMPGYAYSVTVGTGTALQPQYIYAKNGAYWVRFTNTWGTSGGSNGNLTQQVVDVSQDTGSTFANVCTQTFTYDASGNLSSSTGAAGLLALLLPQLGRVTTLTGSFNTHTAATVQHGEEIVTSGGRVLCVTALGDNIRIARQRAYEIAEQIHFEGCQMRRDIGYRALK